MEKELYKNDSPPDDTPFTTYLHNLITTLGAISKGFPDITIHSAKTGKLPAWSGVFKNSLLCVMAVLERLSSTIAIREAVKLRHFFLDDVLINDDTTVS